jgi:hypothetical protein
MFSKTEVSFVFASGVSSAVCMSASLMGLYSAASLDRAAGLAAQKGPIDGLPFSGTGFALSAHRA